MMRSYSSGIYWNEVGRELLKRPDNDGSTIASDDTPYYAMKQARFFNEFLDPALANARSVLEIGQGPGGNLARIRSYGTSVSGVDVSPSMLELARLKGLDVTQMDGIHLPFQDRKYDAVFTSTVLQHNTSGNAARLLAEMARVAAREVHLFEDTAPIYLRDRQSHWLRPPSWYTSRIEPLGYEVVCVHRLRLACQEVSATVARVLVDGRLGQGAPATTRRVRTENLLSRVARPLDQLIPPTVGLTRMSFRRTEQVGAGR